MGAKSRSKGAAGERALVNHAAIYGLSARRVIRTRTSRNPDPGDVHLTLPDGSLIVCQVKVGRAAQDASESTIGLWWGQTLDQTVEAGGDVALLVMQRRGVGMARPSEWVAVLHLADVAWLHDRGTDTTTLPEVVVRLPLGSLLARVS